MQCTFPRRVILSIRTIALGFLSVITLLQLDVRIASEYRLDPERFGVWGSSAGGHLAALVGTSGNAPELEGEVGKHLNVSSNVQAVCDWFGPTDFLQMGGSHNKPDSPESRLVGGAIQENPEKVAAANPIVYVDKNDPPILIMHGDQDPLVPYSQSVLFETSLQTVGVHVELVKMEGHGGRGFDSPKAQEKVTRFFAKHLHPQFEKATEPAIK